MIKVKLFIAIENICKIPEYRRILNRDNIVSIKEDDNIYIYVRDIEDMKSIKKKYNWIKMYMKSTEPIKILYPLLNNNNKNTVIENL